MKRAYVLGVIVMSGALAAAAAQLGAQAPAGAPGAPGQGRPGGPPGGGRGGGGGGGVEAARKIADTLYWVPGAGGNKAAATKGTTKPTRPVEYMVVTMEQVLVSSY